MSYIEGYDYITAHKKWVADHPSFRFGEFQTEYRNVVAEMYYSLLRLPSANLTQRTAHYMYGQDLLHYNHLIEVNKSLMEGLGTQQKVKYFVTIGFNHQTFSLDLFKSWMKVFDKYSWVISYIGKFELFRENGEHPHIHIILETDLRHKGKIIDKLHTSLTSRKHNLIVGKNNIDVKICEDRHYKYIQGIKTDNKVKYTLLDEVYRQDNDIPEFYERK